MFLLVLTGVSMNRISEFRKAANLTQVELAHQLNMTQGALGHYEAGRRNLSLKIARKIVSILNLRGVDCSLDDVFPTKS